MNRAERRDQARRDRYAAATADTSTVMEAAVIDLGMSLDKFDPGEWLHRLYDDAVRRPCPHLASGPQGAFVHARTRSLLCGLCAITEHAKVKGTTEDDTCDRCRRVLRGQLRELMAQVGPVVVGVGLCRLCWPGAAPR